MSGKKSWRDDTLGTDGDDVLSGEDDDSGNPRAKHKLNEEITAPQLRVVLPDGGHKIMRRNDVVPPFLSSPPAAPLSRSPADAPLLMCAIFQALNLAAAQGVDLVQMHTKGADMPVARLISINQWMQQKMRKDMQLRRSAAASRRVSKVSPHSRPKNAEPDHCHVVARGRVIS